VAAPVPLALQVDEVSGSGAAGVDQDDERRATTRLESDDDPTRVAFPEQDPAVEREWEQAKDGPMAGEAPSS
jgi:hypothetical protein